MKELAVVILNWNGIHHLQNFLPLVVEHSLAEADIWVIDNASTDDSLKYIARSHPEIKVLKLAKNIGFAKGYNEGLKQIPNPFYVLLNSDVAVSPNWIRPVMDLLKSDDKMAACQPKILDYKHPDQFEHAGAAGGFIDVDGFTFCAGRIMSAFEKDLQQFDTNSEVFWASGASLFIRAACYHEVGGLDGDFYAHMEEIDLCWRLKNLGYRIGANRESAVYHVGGGTLNKIDPFKTYLNFRNNLFLLTKNYFGGPLWLKLAKRLFLDGLAALRFVTEGKLSYCWAVLRAHASFYRHLPLMINKRRAIHASLKSPNLSGMYTRSILYDFFIQKKQHFNDLEKRYFL